MAYCSRLTSGRRIILVVAVRRIVDDTPPTAVDGRGRLVASFNPQHGFGGLKWDECVGTTRGDRMLSLLTERYCPDRRTAYWQKRSRNVFYTFAIGKRRFIVQRKV